MGDLVIAANELFAVGFPIGMIVIFVLLYVIDALGHSLTGVANWGEV